jgi:hypothetical protein
MFKPSINFECTRYCCCMCGPNLYFVVFFYYCITDCLQVGSNKSHVPWRDSVLTQLLRTSFAGQNTATHTSVVVNVSPEHEDETICTMR